jgi:hypothetical protein
MRLILEVNTVVNRFSVFLERGQGSKEVIGGKIENKIARIL